MKTLIIVRHGKSDWDFRSVKDIDRTLKERGINDGYTMANRLLEKDLIPEIIVSSTANRAFHSALIFSRVLNIDGDRIIPDKNLYLSYEEDILSVIYGCNDDINSLMIFGHNPGFTDLANYLSHLNISNVPTTGIVILNFDVDSWSEISKSNLTNEYFDYPRKV
ncbi:MAG: histidine phosphatase family protein [Bacteroidales bacterium]|nr:histidine phosphatase family protein [Bacteroidales bacterium]